ncbi:MAG: sigma-70 family RNA polymerase sigma factor [Catenulispora sp.]|nr:sigma-70 family RNA polymerase sigma factor [Catenulispora sp.]
MTLAVDHDDIAELAAPFRRELLAHCYRMLGSVHDAEDAVQETMVRAWQGRTGYEGRASLRVWLYRIATNVCLRALERRARLPMPSALGAPSREPEMQPLRSSPEVRWLEPVPDALLRAGTVGSETGLGLGPAADPAAVVAVRAGVRLAFISALQLLPARQRAALILRDVLAFSAQEVAEVLQSSTAAVNSALQRARAQITAVAPAEDDVLEPSEPAVRELLDRYVRAFEHADVDALLRLLRDDVVLEMPPMPAWFRGREDVGRFLAAIVLDRPGRFRHVPTGVNLQPGFAAYEREADGVYRAHGIHGVTVTRTGISRIDAFLDPELFPVFGLPMTLPAAADHHMHDH